MKAVAVFLFVAFALAKADIDYSKVFPLHLRAQYARIPHGIPNPRITGGVESYPNSRPYQVGLFLPVAGGTGFCGGSLIARQTVLTAAHCVDSLVAPALVVLGAHRIQEIEPTQIRVNSSGIYIHPLWSSSQLINDIALIHLPEPVELSIAIQILPLATDTSNSFEGHDARVSGWGRYSDDSNSISPVLREVNIPIIANSVCNIAFLGQIRDTHICASGLGGRSTCNGDSGGPLVVAGEQVGIVSFGIALGCEVGWPSAYTRVTSFIDWIKPNLL